MPSPRIFRPIDQLTAEWAGSSRTAEARRALGLLADAETEIAALGVEDLAELVASLRQPRSVAGRTSAARILQAMLRSQSVHPLVSRAILQALLPGLVTVARRLSWGSGGEWEGGGAFFADVLATAWEVIVSWAGEDRDYAVLDLLSAIRCRVRRQLLKHRTAAATVVLDPDVDERADLARGWGTTALDDLARAIEDMTGRGLDRADAAVLYGHRVLGLSMAELAGITGEPRRRLDGRRHRAEQEFCA
jgi:hypothetical protein